MILRLTEIAGYTDWVMLVSARSERQVQGVVDGVREALANTDAKLIGSDGLDHYLWALLDYDDFLIHVFYHPVRKHYDLESMWSDAPRVELGLPAEVMDLADLEGLSAPEPMPSYRGDLSFGGFEDEFGDDEDGDEEDGEFVDDDEFSDGDEDFDDELFEGEQPPRSPLSSSGAASSGAGPDSSEAELSPEDDLFEP